MSTWAATTSSASLVVDAPVGPTTNCLLDGGLLFWPSTVDFFAQMSWSPDSGVIYWMIQNGPLVDGGISGAEMTATTLSPAQVSSCACVGEVAETVALVEGFGDAGGTPLDLTVPALYWNGLIQDVLTPTNELTSFVFDGGLSCDADAGPGCGLVHARLCGLRRTRPTVTTRWALDPVAHRT